MQLLVILSTLCLSVHCFPEQTRWVNQPANLSGSGTANYHAVLFNQTQVRIKVQCNTDDGSGQDFPNATVSVRWILRHSPCSGNYVLMRGSDADGFINTPDQLFENEPQCTYVSSGDEFNEHSVGYEVFACDKPSVVLPDRSQSLIHTVRKQGQYNPPSGPVPEPEQPVTEPEASRESRAAPILKPNVDTRIATTWISGPYILVIEISSPSYNSIVAKGGKMDVTYDVEFQGPKGYLSILDYPLLVFYYVMCVVYAVFCIVWVIFCARHFTDLLRVQFWIGAVILMGLIEKAVFLGEYEHMNDTGRIVKTAEMAAELVSILKRTIARILVIIVSLGFGIVKPRLGSVMNSVLAVGVCFFVFATIEAGLRIYHSRDDPSNPLMLAEIPLAVTDSIICYWVFSGLMETLKNLKLRRNIVKLTLYRHFMNALVFCVIAAVIYMLWSIREHRMRACVTDWKQLWIDTAYWQLLFSVILCVIIFLWRPSQNNRRYAFSPLMDHEDDEMEEPMIENTNFETVKIRKPGKTLLPQTVDKTDEDHLKWVEDNIPTAGFDTALPSLLDSDEEVMTTKQEMSKQR